MHLNIQKKKHNKIYKDKLQSKDIHTAIHIFK